MSSFLQSPIGQDPVISTALLPADPERVFTSWTEPEEIKSWFGHEPYSVKHAEIDLKVGGRWRFVFESDEANYSALGGEYLTIVRHSKLVFTWCHERATEGGAIEMSAVSEVEVTLMPHDSGTLLTVFHRGVLTEEGRRNVTAGWARGLESLLGRLS